VGPLVAQSALQELLELLELLVRQVEPVLLMERAFVALPIVHLQRRLASDRSMQPLFPTQDR